MDNNQQSVTGIVSSASDKEREFYEELKKLTKKQVRWQRLSAIFMMGLLVVLIAVVVVLLPRILTTLQSMDEAIVQISKSMEEVDAMVVELTNASKNLNDLVDANADPLTSAVSNISQVADEMTKVDFDGLNKAIKDLQDAVSPVANFFNKFR